MKETLFDDITSEWPTFAKKTKRSACALLVDSKYFADVRKNPGLLYSLLTKISEGYGGDSAKGEVLKACVQDLVLRVHCF